MTVNRDELADALTDELGLVCFDRVRELTEDAREKIADTIVRVEVLRNALRESPDVARRLSLVKTKLQEAELWLGADHL